MIFPRAVLKGIAAGRIDLAFRRGASAPVRTGSTRVTDIGTIAFDAVDQVAEQAITDAEARRAGFPDRAALFAWLSRGEGPIHRVALRLAGPDPRVALRANDRLSSEEVAALRRRLERMDAASPRGPWTRAALEAIAAEPGRRAPDLAARLGWETMPFKAAVRRLKALGLTESLDVGYRLSPRGRALLDLLG